jgi:hypothetical protein
MFSMVCYPVFLLFDELAPFVCNFSEAGPERLIHIFVSCVGQAGASVSATCYKYEAFRLVLEIGFVIVSFIGQAGASVCATCEWLCLYLSIVLYDLLKLSSVAKCHKIVARACRPAILCHNGHSQLSGISQSLYIGALEVIISSCRFLQVISRIYLPWRLASRQEIPTRRQKQ